MVVVVSVAVIVVLVAAYCAYNFSEQMRSSNEQFQRLKNENISLQSQCEFGKQWQGKYEELSEKYITLQKDNSALSTRLEEERKLLAEKMQLLEKAEQKLSDTFKALSSDALSRNNKDFMELAKSLFDQIQARSKADMELNSKNVSELLTPIKNALSGVDTRLVELEKSRVGAYEALRQQVSDLMNTESILKNETTNLVSALKTPNIRGRWGEIQLRRVVELAGMIEHCDFQEQVTSNDDAKIRPDMVIYYPGDKQVIVDAKTPLAAYLQSLETQDESQRKKLLLEYVRQIKNQVTKLSNKQYWSQFRTSPEFVIMFLPGEVFLSVAIENDPSIIEFAMQKRVIITTPTILLALLQTISLGWQQQKMAEHAEQIKLMGQELYQRLSDTSRYIANIGKSLNSAVGDYNRAVGNIENRVLVTIRKFTELKASDKEILELQPIDANVRELNLRD